MKQDVSELGGATGGASVGQPTLHFANSHTLDELVPCVGELLAGASLIERARFLLDCGLIAAAAAEAHGALIEWLGRKGEAQTPVNAIGIKRSNATPDTVRTTSASVAVRHPELSELQRRLNGYVQRGGGDADQLRSLIELVEAHNAQA
jgi:hypothetical protein